MAEEILIVESTPEIADVLEEVLTDDGYDARAEVAPAEDAVAAVQEHRPDALALALPPHAVAAGEALDALRTDPIAREVPVLTLATDRRINAAARASYTVQETLDKPFDLDEALDKVARTLAQPPVQALVGEGEPLGALAQAEPLVARYAREILLGWAEKRRDQEPWASRPEASTGEILGDTPMLLDAIDASFRRDEPVALFDHPAVAERIVRRGDERRARGVSETGAVAELTAIREDVWAMLIRELPAELPEADAQRLREVLDGAVDRIVALTLAPPADEAVAAG